MEFGTFLIVLLCGTLAMLFPIMMQSKWRKIRFWKSIIVSVLLTLVGTLGTYIMFFVENGTIGGRSFYGAVFLVPVVFVLFSFILKIPYGILLDLCAPAECVMLALMKILCCITGCCAGRALFTAANGNIIRFPSQIVELVVAVALFVFLLFLSKSEKRQGTIYPLYLILYGGTRFVLNFLRAEWENVTWPIPYGTIWSFVSIVLGITVLAIVNYKQKKDS